MDIGLETRTQCLAGKNCNIHAGGGLRAMAGLSRCAPSTARPGRNRAAMRYHMIASDHLITR